MSRSKKTKSSFRRDEDGRVVLGSAKEMAEWVKLGFAEQQKSRPEDEAFLQDIIDLSNCSLYISYPVGSKTPSAKIFNLCDMADIVPGIKKLEGDPRYLFEVTLDIRLDGSVLLGNFFHYVKFDGRLLMSNTTVVSTCSFFKCHFAEFVYMDNVNIKGRCDFEQCVFDKGLLLSGAQADLFHFNYCSISDKLSLKAAKLVNHNNKDYEQSIRLTNSNVEGVNLSRVHTGGLPIYFGDSKVKGIQLENVNVESPVVFNTVALSGLVTMLANEGKPKNHVKVIHLHNCDVAAQCHIENTDIEDFVFNFGRIDNLGRLRLYQCSIGALNAQSSSVFGQLDILEIFLTFFKIYT